jgi:hypothetical protein
MKASMRSRLIDQPARCKVAQPIVTRAFAMCQTLLVGERWPPNEKPLPDQGRGEVS